MKRKITTLALLSIFLFLLTSFSGIGQVINTFPYIQTFETFDNCTAICGIPCDLSNGWVNITTGDDQDWTIHNGKTPTGLSTNPNNATGPCVDLTTGTETGRYAYIESSGGCVNNNLASMVSPTLDLTGITDFEMIFGNHMFGGVIGTLNVDVSVDAGISWTNVWTQSGNQGNQWNVETISLNAFAGEMILVRFNAITLNFTSDIAIDDITFRELLPNDAGVTNITTLNAPFCNVANIPFTVNIKNFGANDLTSVDINWSINDVLQTPFNWTGSIPSLTSEIVTLGTTNLSEGDNVMAWTSNPNMTTEPADGAGNDSYTSMVKEALGGTLDIGLSGQYPTIVAAVDDLLQRGICQALVFNIEDGTYTEQIEITEIPGASPSARVTIQSESADPAMVTITHETIRLFDNYTLRLNGADYVTIRHLTVENTGQESGDPTIVSNGATTLVLANGANFCRVENNIFNGNSILENNNPVYNTVSSDGSPSLMASFTNNTFNFGAAAFNWEGENTASGLLFENNVVQNAFGTGVRINNILDPQILNNRISQAATPNISARAIAMINVDGAYLIDGNIITANTGILITDCDSPDNKRSYISNNWIFGGISFSTSTNQVIANNSLSADLEGRALINFISIFQGSGTWIYNNSIYNRSGFAIWIDLGVSMMDNNNLFSLNHPIGRQGSANFETLNDWQQATGYDESSISTDPQYFNDLEDLHTCNDQLDGRGIIDFNVLTDFDGQTRDLTNGFDIGADEFLGIENFGFASDTIFKCEGDTIFLGGFEPTTDATYTWSTSETSPSIEVIDPGLYTLDINATCGESSSMVQVIDITEPEFTFTIDQLEVAFMSSSIEATSFEWDFGDGNTSSLENPSNTYATDGEYLVTLSVTTSCGTFTVSNSILISTVSVEENPLNRFLKVFPNPSNGLFTINLDINNVNQASAVLLNTMGQEVWSKEFGTGSLTISESVHLSTIAKGVYFLHLNVNDQSIVRKILIQK